MRTVFLCSVAADCRDVLLPLVTDQLSGQLDDHSSKPDHEACVQLLSTVLDNLDRKDVVRGQSSPLDAQRVEVLREKASSQNEIVDLSGCNEFSFTPSHVLKRSDVKLLLFCIKRSRLR